MCWSNHTIACVAVEVCVAEDRSDAARMTDQRLVVSGWDVNQPRVVFAAWLLHSSPLISSWGDEDARHARDREALGGRGHGSV